MTIQFTLTDKAGQVLVNPGNDGVSPVIFTRMAIGTGKQDPTGAETALTTQALISDFAGNVNAANDEIAGSALFTGNSAVDATEVGLFAKVGSGSEFLALYWSTAAGTIGFRKLAGQSARLDMVLKFATAAKATITFQTQAVVAFTATTTQAGTMRFATDGEVGSRADVQAAVRPPALPTIAEDGKLGVMRFANQQERQDGFIVQAPWRPGSGPQPPDKPVAARIEDLPSLRTRTLWEGSTTGSVALHSGEDLSQWQLLIFGLQLVTDQKSGVHTFMTTYSTFKKYGLAWMENDGNRRSWVIYYVSDTAISQSTIRMPGERLRYILGIGLKSNWLR